MPKPTLGQGQAFPLPPEELRELSPRVWNYFHMLHIHVFGQPGGDGDLDHENIVGFNRTANNLSDVADAETARTNLEISHFNLPDVSANQHHNQIHELWSTDHSDVLSTDIPADGEAIVWDATIGKWIVDTIAGTGGTPSATVVSETSFGQASSAGASSDYSRGDHTHGTPTDPGTVPAFGSPTGSINIGDSQSDGVASTVPRSDHKHNFTAPGVGYPLDIAGTEADGVATTPARSDHVHRGVTSVNGSFGAVTVSGGSGTVGSVNDEDLFLLMGG